MKHNTKCILAVAVGITIVAAVTVIVWYSMSHDNYSYIQYLQPDDELRTSIDLGDDSAKEQTVAAAGREENAATSAGMDTAATSACGCGALSEFEIPYYMQGSMCKFGTDGTFRGDPGYFLGRTVI